MDVVVINLCKCSTYECIEICVFVNKKTRRPTVSTVHILRI